MNQFDSSIAGDNNANLQFGEVHGDAVFHEGDTIYQFGTHDSPQQKFDVGRNYLAGSSPRIAERLFAECVYAGFTTSELAYDYALAILSERSISQLGPQELDNLQTALNLANQCTKDGWYEAITVIWELVTCVLTQETSREPDPGTLAAVLDLFAQLPQQRKEEITRHLDMIIGGAVQDQLDHVNAADVEHARMSGYRSIRAWKFFQPVPAQPRLAAPYFTRPASGGVWLMLVLGTLGVALWFLWDTSLIGVAETVLLLAACGLTVWFGAHLLAARLRRSRLEFELGDGDKPEGCDEQALHLGSQLFRRRIDGMIKRRLGREQPLDWAQQQAWQADLGRPAYTLFNRLVRTYGQPLLPGARPDTPVTQRESEVFGLTLNWLIFAQIRYWSRQRANGTLFDYRATTPAENRDKIVVALGVVLAVVAVLGLSGTFGIGKIIAVAVIAILAVLGWVKLLGSKHAVAGELADCRTQLAWEQAEYRKWQDKLADRPTDIEMARWLDFDKSYLKTEAMRHADLTNRDIVGHVVLTEGLPKARRARVSYGPPRYDAYRVLVFLLTENGVWEYRVDLNFSDGSVRNKETSSFRYESLVRVRVVEVGVRFAGERRHVMVISADNVASVTGPVPGVLLRKALWLSLANQDDIQLVLENFDGLRGQAAEDNDALEQLALGSSGAATAVRILQSVAGEGREWITKQRQRQRRRIQEWNQSSRGRQSPLGLPPAPQANQVPTPPQPTAQPKPGQTQSQAAARSGARQTAQPKPQQPTPPPFRQTAQPEPRPAAGSEPQPAVRSERQESTPHTVSVAPPDRPTSPPPRATWATDYPCETPGHR
ncbi:MAG TPA: hypothetical protein VJ914_05040 [Pseudonocardiaceae bacterium]|nr:hypothetical protein [Pseudonocardiaceae bacterium]